MSIRLHLFLNRGVRGRMVEGVEDSWLPGVRNNSSRCHISERRGVTCQGASWCQDLMKQDGNSHMDWGSEKESRQESAQAQPKTMSGKGG